MRWNGFAHAFVLAAVVLPGSAWAQTLVCTARDMALLPAMTGWTSKSAINSAADIAGLGKAALVTGTRATATLHPTRDVTYVIQPERPAAPAAFGGMFGIEIAKAGTYEIALGAGAWIDVIAGKKAVISSAHSHGPDCSTIRKVVDFPLSPGRYVVQISADAEPKLAIMVVRHP